VVASGLSSMAWRLRFTWWGIKREIPLKRLIAKGLESEA
jgi:hypothetical protein